jgi:hypothetical protein
MRITAADSRTANGTTPHNYTGVEQKTRAFLESLQEQGGPGLRNNLK